MAAAPSFDDLVIVALAELQNARPDIRAADGDVSLAMVHGGAGMANAVLRFAAQKYKETFIDGATGDALTALVDDHFNLQRQEATAASVTAQFERTSGGSAGTILAGTTIATETDENGEAIEFTTDTNITVTAGQNGPYSVTATASTTGRDTNVAASTVVRLIDEPSFDSTFSVTNLATAAGGNDEEKDPELRSRVRSYFKTLRKGTLAALEQGAKDDVPEVRVAVATEDNNGNVTLYVSDSDGNSSVEMINDVTTAITVDWKAAGTRLTITGGAQVVVDLTVAVSDYRTGFDVSAQAAIIQAAIDARIDKLQAGETLYLDTIIHAAIAAFPDDIRNITITSITKDGSSVSVADVTAGATEVIRPGTITVS